MNKAAPGPGVEASADRVEVEVGVKAKEDVPVWWLFVISSYCIPLGLTNTLIGQILLPPLIQKCVGNENKHAALGLAASICSGIHSARASASYS